MATSGTTSATVFETRKVIERAFRRAKVPSELISGEYLDIANDNLYLLLSHLANLGAPLWCIQKLIIPAYQGQAIVPLGASTVDVLNAEFRLIQAITGTNTVTATTYQVTFASPTQVSTVGLYPAVNQALNLVFETSTNGTTWTTALAVGAVTYLAGQIYWYDLDGTIPQTYFRVRDTALVPVGINFSQVVTGNTPSAIPMSRYNRDDYTALPNLTSPGKPLQYWMNRQIPQPFMYTWPVCDATNAVGQFVVWVHQYIQDVGSMSQTLFIPQRWFMAVVSGLAAELAAEVQVDYPQLITDATVANLRIQAQRFLQEAQDEERDNSPYQFVPQIAVYTI